VQLKQHVDLKPKITTDLKKPNSQLKKLLSKGVKKEKKPKNPSSEIGAETGDSKHICQS